MDLDHKMSGTLRASILFLYPSSLNKYTYVDFSYSAGGIIGRVGLAGNSPLPLMSS